MAQDIEKAQTPAQRETQLADDYLTGAQLAREVSHHALRQALAEAKAGQLRDPAKTAMNAAITSGTLLDKRLLLEGRPNQITAHTDPRAEIRAMARDFHITTIDTTAEPIETPQLPAGQAVSPLLGESVGAKPRARARKRPVQTAAD